MFWICYATAFSQAALAERMGVDRAYVSGLEKGERNLRSLRYGTPQRR